MKLVSRTLCLAIVPLMFACGAPNSTSETKERIDASNDPGRLNVPVAFHRDPDVFPLQASVDKPAWSGNWWPLSQGGTAKAMKKYDAVTGNGNKAENWELQTASDAAGVSWAGHCSGLAAAGINEDHPKHDVNYHGQNFTVSDIEGLLVEKWQGTSRIQLVGKRCNQTPTMDSQGRPVETGCRDINPGALHIIMGNMIGLQKKPFILDIFQGDQVWNYPAVSYSTTLSEIDLNTARSLTSAVGSNYSWDPEANQFMKVRALVKTAAGSTLTLDYVLEGKNGEITGGEWIGNSRANHPDFAWYAKTPDPQNPFLNVSVIDEIANLSRQ